MERRILAGEFLFLGMIWLSLSTPARADVDLSGRWFTQAGPDPCQAIILVCADRCQLEFSLSDTDLTLTGSCALAGAIGGSGTFDAASGHFSISGSAEQFCQTFKIDATVAPDGATFAGTVDCEDLGTLRLTGSHCGKGLLCATDDALREAIEQALAGYQSLGLRGLLRPGAVGFVFAAPSSGRLEVSLDPLARGRAEIEAPGQVVLQLCLTRRGRRLLRRRKQLSLALEATFTGPAGTVTEAGRVTVVRQPPLQPQVHH